MSKPELAAEPAAEVEGRPTTARLMLGVGGLVLIGVGLFELMGFGLLDLFWLALWLGAGVFLHDGVFGPATAILSRKAAARWSVKWRRIPLITLVCIATMTLIAVPLILAQGSVAGNPTLLGRNYLAGWAAACLLIVIGAALAEVRRRVRAGLDRRDGRVRD